MSLDNYPQFQNAGQNEVAPGQPTGQNGAAPGQPNEPAGVPPMAFPPQDGQPMGSPAPGQEGKTTLW